MQRCHPTCDPHSDFSMRASLRLGALGGKPARTLGGIGNFTPVSSRCQVFGAVGKTTLSFSSRIPQDRPRSPSALRKARRETVIPVQKYWPLCAETCVINYLHCSECYDYFPQQSLLYSYGEGRF